MSAQISAEMKKNIFELISTPGVEVKDIPAEINRKFGSDLNYEELMKFLEDEYLRHDLNYGRRICCRF